MKQAFITFGTKGSESYAEITGITNSIKVEGELMCLCLKKVLEKIVNPSEIELNVQRIDL